MFKSLISRLKDLDRIDRKTVKARGCTWLQGNCVFRATGLIHKWTHKDYDSINKIYTGLNSDKIPTLRRENGHKAPFLTKKLFASYISWKGEKEKFSPVEWHWDTLKTGPIPLSSWPLQHWLHGLFCLFLNRLLDCFDIFLSYRFV